VASKYGERLPNAPDSAALDAFLARRHTWARGGQQIRVKLVSTDVERGFIDFVAVD
jgi:hypothetical protein